MDIYVPSSGRAQHQPTLTALVEAGLAPVLVVQQREFEDYFAAWGKTASIIALPPSITTIAPTRQYILENCGSSDTFVMCDDDLTFYARRLDYPTRLRDMFPGELCETFNELELALQRHAHAGLAAREGANRNATPFLYNTRIMRVLGYQRDPLISRNIRFDDMEVMEDFHVALRLLEAGFTNCVVNGWAHNQKGSSSAGGCSVWRTPALHAAAAHQLATLHPGVVQVVEKETKQAWGGGVRTDVRIAWKKAYNQKASRYVD